MSDDTPEVLVQDELEALKTRADMLKVKYHPSISLEKLREKVNAAIEADAGEPEAEAEVGSAKNSNPMESVNPVGETDSERRKRKRREANELVRIRVTCMNPAKKEWDGEIFTAGNSLVGSFTKYIPFNAEEGWHVPRIIYNQLVQRQCQIFVTQRDSRGNQSRKGKLIKEFAIEVLPQLTADELQDLAQRQAMAKSID